MSTQDNPQPTPGPWEVSEVSKATVVADRYGTETAIANTAVYQTSEHDVFEENLANAELIAAAGTAAHEAAEMGYDSQKAVEALPKILQAAQALIESAEQDVGNNAFGGQSPKLLESPARETIDNLKDALASAEGTTGE